jgi:hypothetical protein
MLPPSYFYVLAYSWEIEAAFRGARSKLMPILMFDTLSRCSIPTPLDSKSPPAIDMPKEYVGGIFRQDSDPTAGRSDIWIVLCRLV